MRPRLALCAALFALVFYACGRNPDGDTRCLEVDAGAPIDPPLLAFLSRARAAHHLADEREGQGDLPAAVAPLSALVAGPLPRPARRSDSREASGDLAPEVREVLADTRARLADLRSRSGDFEQAQADIEAGLEQARESNYFRGHLLETAGLVQERRAQVLSARDPSAAAAARKQAITLLEQAMALQAQVIEKSEQRPLAMPARTPNNAPR